MAIPILSKIILFALVTAAAFFDIRTRRIPNKLVLAGLACAAALAAAQAVSDKDASALARFALGALAGGVPMLAVALLTKGGMGMGDVKLAAMIGAFLEPAHALFALFASVLTGGAYGLAVIAAKKKDLRSQIAFAPFLAVGAVAAMLFGETVINMIAALYNY